uniref:Uncharacterized protein n=1 Tax=Lepeophtheirus salmonis TaxID=72036 RepID=A0A0K2V5U7_LEPSM
MCKTNTSLSKNKYSIRLKIISNVKVMNGALINSIFIKSEAQITKDDIHYTTSYIENANYGFYGM